MRGNTRVYVTDINRQLETQIRVANGVAEEILEGLDVDDMHDASNHLLKRASYRVLGGLEESSLPKDVIAILERSRSGKRSILDAIKNNPPDLVPPRPFPCPLVGIPRQYGFDIANLLDIQPTMCAGVQPGELIVAERVGAAVPLFSPRGAQYFLSLGKVEQCAYGGTSIGYALRHSQQRSA